MASEPDDTRSKPGNSFGFKLTFFSWVMPALKNRRTLKTWIRCLVALAVTLILMVDDKTGTSMGQAGFFAAIVSVMLPPTLVLSLFVFASFTLLIGMVIGWAWGCAAMAAGISVRSQALLMKQQQEAQSSIVAGIPASLQLQRFVFEGLFLDPRTSAVYGVFLFIGTFALGTLRAYIPKLSLLSIFGSIVLDVMCTYGPSFPSSQYTIAKMFLIPSCYYVAIAIASLVLIFPESLNHSWLTSLGNGVITPALGLVSLQNQALKSRPSDRKAWAELSEKGSGLRQAISRGTEQLIGQTSFVDIEISVGRLGPGDLKRISGELKSLMFRAVGLHSFQTFVNDMNTVDEVSEKELEASIKGGTSTPLTSERFMKVRREIKEKEIQHGHDLDSLIPILAESSAELRMACESGVKQLKDWLEDCNSGRWVGFFSRSKPEKLEQRHVLLEDRMKELDSALEEFRKSKREKLVKPYERFFDSGTGKILDSVKKDKEKEMFTARSLFLCFVFVDTLDAFAERLLGILHILVDMDAKRPRPRVWMPSGFGKLWRKLTSDSEVYGTSAPLMMGTSNDPTAFEPESSKASTNSDDSDDEDELKTVTITRRNPDALPPTTPFGKFFVRLGNFLRFFKSPEGIFSLRLAIVSVALWVPSVCHASAWFYYENRGLWALIMAQTGLALYAGDQISSFFVRMAGTFIGLLFGMAAWYIGAGHGDGNPYGIVIATTVVVAPFLLARLCAPPQQMMMWVLSGVTVVFVVGYSWINTHQAVIVSSGVGVELGWKRALLVIIGFTAGFIVMLFPKPSSARTLVRRTLGATTAEFGYIFAGEVEAFLAEEQRARSGHYEKIEFMEGKDDKQKPSPKERRVRKLAKKFLDVSGRLQGLAPSLSTAKFEPQLQGIWPQDKYQLLYKTQTKLMLSLALLISAFTKLDTEWCSILVHRTPFLNPNFLSDIFSTISILSQALSAGKPLPPGLPSLRDRLVYHDHHRKNAQMGPSSTLIRRAAVEPEDPRGEVSSVAELTDGPSIGFEELTLDVLMDEQLPAHSTAVVALSNVMILLDDITDIVRSLCGEMSFGGFDKLQRDFLGEEEKALGSGIHSKMR